MSQFQDLPNEIILKVLSYLKVKELVCCGQTSKRIRAVSNYETLYQKIDLSGKKVQARFLERIINKGCKDLNLIGALLKGSDFNLSKKSELKILDFNFCAGSKKDMEILTDSCVQLKKISIRIMTKLFLSSSMIKSMCSQNSQTLQVLNLEKCGGTCDESLSKDQIWLIVQECVFLKEVIFNNISLSSDSMAILANNLTPNIQKLSLRQCQPVRDWHIDILARRCNQICVLDLKGTSITGYCLPEIIRNLKDTLRELNVQTWGVSLHLHGSSDKVFELKSLTRLAILHVKVGHFMERRLKKELIGITIINQEY